MTPDAMTARRALIRAYLAYVRAETDLDRALRDAAAYLPGLQPHGLRPIGSPGSRIRKLTEIRSHSIEVLEVTRGKHRRALTRLARIAPQMPPKALL